MIKKAETTRISIVLENSMLKILDNMATAKNETRSETIRRMLNLGCNWYTQKKYNNSTDENTSTQTHVQKGE